jgi:hypothetical protein
MSIYSIYEDVRHFSPHSYNVTINSHNGQLTLYTLIHMREGRTILGAKSELPYSETAPSRNPLGVGNMYIYNFMLRMTDTMTSQNTDLSSWDILYIHI